MKRSTLVALLFVLLVSGLVPTRSAAADGIFNWWIVPVSGLTSLQVTRFTDTDHGGAWAMSPDDDLIAVSTDSGIRVMSLDPSQKIDSLIRGIGTVREIEWHPDNVIICKSDWGSSASTTWFQISWPDTTQSILAQGVTGALFFSPDRKMAFCIESTSTASASWFLDLKSGAKIPIPRKCSTALWDPSGTRIAVRCNDGLIIMNRRGEVVSELLRPLVTPLDWSIDGRYVLATAYRKSLILVDSFTGNVAHEIPVDSFVPTAALSPDGHGVAYTTFESKNDGSSLSSLWIADWNGMRRKIVGEKSGFVGDPQWTHNGAAIVVPVKGDSSTPILDLPCANNVVSTKDVSVDTDALAQRIDSLEKRVTELERLAGIQQTSTQQHDVSPQDKRETVAKFQGSGIVNTQPFTVNRGWTIEWNSGGDIFQVYIYTKTGQLVDVAANQVGPGRGSSHQPQGGTYYLKVNALGDWEIVITQ